LVVSYNGAGFHGFQYQNEELPTVQSALERAIARVADHPVQVTCAGRTDTGVHATHQVVHFDSENDRPLKAWIHGVNRYLPHSIAISWVGEMAGDFSARFSATARRYLYLIYNSAVRSSFLSQELTFEHRPLDEVLMHEGGQHLVGEHDFSSFRAAGCQARTPVRTITSLDVFRRGDLVVVDVRANAFLHHMVRNIVGLLTDVGRGRVAPAKVAEVLERRDRAVASVTAPSNGLYLIDVVYPASLGLPSGPTLPHLYSLVAS
jgi:tRNA pseudouridine38-40 synthase